MKRLRWGVGAALLLMPLALSAQNAIPLLTVEPAADGGSNYSVSLQILLLMTVLTMLPAVLLAMTSFTRIVVVLAILRQALGTAQTPSNQILIGLALFLTFFIMGPVLSEIYEVALQPYLADQISAQAAIDAAQVPLREFMMAQTRDDDIA
ncbi:MAG: flagellar biosynthetic protein FliP, partial [Halioglobus sp.]|nr:flagellar biosynthetic protein FliP [Halioglobus sp.]